MAQEQLPEEQGKGRGEFSQQHSRLGEPCAARLQPSLRGGAPARAGRSAIFSLSNKMCVLKPQTKQSTTPTAAIELPHLGLQGRAESTKALVLPSL